MGLLRSPNRYKGTLLTGNKRGLEILNFARLTSECDVSATVEVIANTVLEGLRRIIEER